MVTKFFLESHTKVCCDQPTESHGAAKPKGSEPGVIQTRLLPCGLWFESGAQVHEVYSCSGSENLNKVIKRQDFHTKPCSPEYTGLLMTGERKAT